MAPRRISNSSYTLQIYKGITYSRTFQYKDGDGAPINLTNKSIVIQLKDIFTSTLQLGSSLPNSTLGSNVTITDAVNGKFRLLVTDEETATAELGKGRWWIELHDAGDVTLLWRDDIQVEEV